MASKRTIATQVAIGVVVFVAGSLIVSEIRRRTNIGRDDETGSGLDG